MSASANATIFNTVLGVALGLVFGGIPILKDMVEERFKKQFRRQLTEAIVVSGLSYQDLQHMAERWSQDRKAVLLCLRVLLSNALSGDEPKLKDFTEAIRKLLYQHQEAEPYAELPENISLHLAALPISGEKASASVGQLAASLSELYSSNQRKLSRQGKLTFWGVVIGIIGTAVGVISWVA